MTGTVCARCWRRSSQRGSPGPRTANRRCSTGTCAGSSCGGGSESQHFPFPPEVGQRGDDIHRAQRPCGDPSGREIRGAAKRLRSERGRGVCRESLRERRADQTAQDIAAAAGGKAGVPRRYGERGRTTAQTHEENEQHDPEYALAGGFLFGFHALIVAPPRALSSLTIWLVRWAALPA